MVYVRKPSYFGATGQAQAFGDLGADGVVQVSGNRNGGEDADCVFPDGSRCGQWDFLSGRCGQEFSYCKIESFNLEEGTNIGICRFPDFWLLQFQE